MKQKMNRRNFLKKSSHAGMACCALMMSPGLLSARTFFEDEKIDPKKLNFCGYTCPADCKFYNATIENNLEKKKEAFEIWHIKERYGVEYDENIAFCWKCKNMDKPAGVVLSNCTVRSCAMEKGYDGCIQCNDLSICDKDLWNRFPDFYKAIKEMQVKYKDQIA